MSSISTSDWTTVGGQSSTAATSGFASQSLSTVRLAEKSTPVKQRNTSCTYTLDSVNESWREELKRHRYSGITAEELLKQALALSDNDMRSLKADIASVAVHLSGEYKLLSGDFYSKANTLEVDMYEPFAGMANMILRRHRDDSTLHHIKVLPFTGNDYMKGDRYGERKPDVLLVPEKDGQSQITMDSVRWHHLLLVMEFKKRQGKKRAGDGDLSEQRERPAKRQSSSTSRLAVQDQPLTAEHTSRTSATFQLEASASESQEIVKASSPASSLSMMQESGLQQDSEEPMIPGPVQGSVSGREIMEPPHPQTLQATPHEATELSVFTSPGHPDDKANILRRTRRTPVSVSSHVSSASSMKDSPEQVEVVKREVQLANYVAEVMSEFADRSFSFGAIVVHTSMRLTYYSRSVYIVSEPFDIVEDPVMFAILFLLFSRQPLEKLGFNTDIGYCNPFDTKVKRKLNVVLNPIKNGGDNLELKPGTELKLGKRIHSEYCLMGRATSIYDIERPEGCKVDLVVKISWQVKKRRREDIAIRIARCVSTVHSPEIYGQTLIADKSPSKLLLDACLSSDRPTRPCREYEELELRIILMRKYESVEKLNDEEFGQVVPQFAAYVHDLYRKKGLMHRDISIFNMMFYRDGGKVIGVLIDFDLATYPEEVALSILLADDPPLAGMTSDTSAESSTSGTPSQEQATTLEGETLKNGQDRSGTTPFMAIETLDVENSTYRHHLCHELESLMYGTVWHGVGYRYKAEIFPRPKAKKGKEPDYLRTWRVGTWAKVMKAKVDFLENPGWITSKITDDWLRVACKGLAYLFWCRRDVALNAWRRMDSKAIDVERRIVKLRKRGIIFEDTIPEVPPMIYENAIYPGFARAWDMGLVECENDCCVSTLVRRS